LATAHHSPGNSAAPGVWWVPAYIHLVFSTRDRWPFLRDPACRGSLHEYLGGISKQLDCPPVSIGGVEDHVHLLCRLGRTISQADWVKELKRVSSSWLKPQSTALRSFAWQGGTAIGNFCGLTHS